MEKLTKENIYIDLRGKSKEELTDLWEFLDSIGEKLHRDLEWFLEYAEEICHFGYNGVVFCHIGIKISENKQEVTIEQLKEILQPMGTEEFEKLFNYAKSVDFKISDLAVYINKEISFDYYDQLEGDEPEDKAHLFILKYKDIDLSLEQQLQKAEAEVKRLQSLIEEENKPKVGDVGYFYDDGNEESKLIGKLTAITTLYYAGDINFDNFKKITNPELIKLLENECSTKN